jgi:NTE family protein
MHQHFLSRRFGAGLCLAIALSGCGSLSTTTPTLDVGQNPKLTERRELKLGLALGGGAARGFAHLGVIEVLEEAGLRPSHVVGTSAGSLVAALYASGKNSAELEQAALHMDESTIADWTLPLFNRGVLRGEALAKYVNQQVKNRQIQEMKLPLGILATDLVSGDGVLFQRGDTGTAVRASSAVPGVFVPVSISGREYVDGGLVAPVPVVQARQMGAELVLAVDISSPPQANTNDAFKVVLQTFSIMGQSINRMVLQQADVVVRPSLAGVGSADFSNRQRSIAAGAEAMRALLPKLKEQLQAKRRPVSR